VLGEWALSMVGVEEGREFRFRRDLYSQESTFPLVVSDMIGSESDLLFEQFDTFLVNFGFWYGHVLRKVQSWS